MNVVFYFCPSCPFCWITSRWLLDVSGQREIHIDWQPFSLALKNNEVLDDGHLEDNAPHGGAHRVLRALLAAQDSGAELIELYSVIGVQHHIAGKDFDDALIAEMLAEKNLSSELIKAADDASYDKRLQESIDNATAIAGQDIGVPTIIFENQDGTKNGFFGPVLQELPDKNESLELWDGLSKLAANKSFYELKRSRPDGGPNTASTARC